MAAQANQPLREGSMLEKYRVLKLIAAGGTSFVYLAHDERDMPVVIKEYLPATLALRTDGEAAARVPEAHHAQFVFGMKCFFEEGRALAHLAHPNVVRVLNFFRANETAYMVMRYERGRSLQEHIESRRGALPEAWIRTTFTQLLNGLREVHAQKLLHLDVKPGNVYLRNDGTPLLIDFGAARQALAAEGAPKLALTYTPGFASPEQQAGFGSLGPWSDIYSVGATLYACLAAAAPPSAEERLREDKLEPVGRTYQGRYSKSLLDTIELCLRLDPLARPQSVLALQKALVSGADGALSESVMHRLLGMLQIRVK